MAVLLTVFLVLAGAFLGLVLVPLLSYLVGVRSLGGLCFMLGQMANNGTCLFYEAQKGYFLLPMRRGESDTWEILRGDIWTPLKNNSVMMLGNRPFGISYLPEKAAFRNELETRVFSRPIDTKPGEDAGYLQTGDEIGDMVGIIPSSVSSEISNESSRTGFVISLRLLVARLSESGGFGVGNRAIQSEMTKAALKALSGQSTNAVLIISSLVAVVMGAVFGYFIFFHTGPLFS